MRGDKRCEGKPDTELFELHRDGHTASSPLRDGNGKLATGEKAGFLAAGGHQVGFGQDLQQAAGLHVTDDGAEVDIAPERKNVQNVGHGKRPLASGKTTRYRWRWGGEADARKLSGR